MSRRTFLAAVVTAVALAATALPAAALSLGDAKAQGLVGEQADGYLGVVGSGPPEARQLANDVNAERRKEYEGIAKKRGVEAAAVAALAGKKLVERTPQGQFVRGSDGRWVKK
jgi:uncharacterized protein YdbL (DUF1318 family)